MGLDIKTRGTTGHEIVASHDGYLSRMVSNYSGYGKALYIKTTSGNEIVYGHLERFTPVLEKVWRLQQAKRRSYVVNANFSSRESARVKQSIASATMEAAGTEQESVRSL